MAGQYWFGDDSFADLVEVLRTHVWMNHAPQADTCFGLTVRELEIVSALAAAYCNKEIAQKLSISEKTVKHHLSNIFAKLGLSRRLELALFAVKHRLPLAHIVTVSQSR